MAPPRNNPARPPSPPAAPDILSVAIARGTGFPLAAVTALAATHRASGTGDLAAGDPQLHWLVDPAALAGAEQGRGRDAARALLLRGGAERATEWLRMLRPDAAAAVAVAAAVEWVAGCGAESESG